MSVIVFKDFKSTLMGRLLNNERSVVPHAPNPITEGAEARMLGSQASLYYIMSLRPT